MFSSPYHSVKPTSVLHLMSIKGCTPPFTTTAEWQDILCSLHTHKHEYGWFWVRGLKTHPEIPLFSKPTWPEWNICSLPGLCADCNQGTFHSVAEDSPSFRALLRNYRQNSTPTATKVCNCQRVLVLSSLWLFCFLWNNAGCTKEKNIPYHYQIFWFLLDFSWIGVWAEEHITAISPSKILFLTSFF